MLNMETDIKNHYNSDNLTQNIRQALISAGKDLEPLDPKEISRIDQLHTGGVSASIDLIKKAGLGSDDRVLDAGCGIGGSSRLLAGEFNCRVAGIDLAGEFIDAADFLTRCTKLENLIEFYKGSIISLPFSDNTFDVVWCQHVLMNIINKTEAVREFYRVLKPSGKLVLHEIFKGQNNCMAYPVPWASEPSISFLESWDHMADILDTENFKTIFYSDQTASACQWWEKVKKISGKKNAKNQKLGPALILGQNAARFGTNMYSNFTQHTICLIEAVLQKSL